VYERICLNTKCKKPFTTIRLKKNNCSTKCSKATYQFNKLKKEPFYYSLNQRKNRYKNIDLYRNKQKDYYYKNKEHRLNCHKKYRSKNKVKISIQHREYFLKNKYIKYAQNSKRRANLLKAVPKFANIEKIKEIYKNCPKGYHVDHIVPLQGKNVCGLHVEWNLQYLTAAENLSKNNKFY